MIPKQTFLDLLNGVGKKTLFVPLADKLFASGVVDKKWVSEVTTEEEMEAAQVCGYFPLLIEYNLFEQSVLGWTKRTIENSDERRETEISLETPWGRINMIGVETPCEGVVTTKFCFDSVEDFRIYDWYLDMLFDHVAEQKERFSKLVKIVGDQGIVALGLPHPIEFFRMWDMQDTIFAWMDFPERCRKLTEKLVLLNSKFIETAFSVGVKLCYTGLRGTELYNLEMIREEAHWLVQMRSICEANGGYLYLHNCGFCKAAINDGLINKIRPHIYETLSPPPAGEIENLEAMRKKIFFEVVTKGNLDLKRLLKCTPEEARRDTLDILHATKGYRHLVGTADALLRGTPIKNLRAVKETVDQWMNPL